MKKLLFISCLIISAGALKAQEGSLQNAIKINPLSLIFATGNISYERAIATNQSFQLGMFYSGVGISGIKYSGLGITPEYRFYFAGRKTAMNGVYAAPFLRYQNYTLKNKESSSKASFSSFGGGATLGWEKTWDSGFVLDIFAGPAFNSGKVKADNDEENDDFDISSGIDGFGLRTGITLGFAF